MELGEGRACDYAIGFLEDAQGKIVAVYGARLEGRDASGHVTYRVTDDFPYPKLQEGFDFVYFNCRSASKHDFTLVAVVKADREKQWWDAVLWAKQYEFASGKFVDVRTEGVSCANESWGL